MAEQLSKSMLTARSPYVISCIHSYLTQKILQIKVNRTESKWTPLRGVSIYVDSPVSMVIAFNTMAKVIAFILLTNPY